MFSKAKLKRFNEEVGCAPAPTAYNPKVLDKSAAASIDKSNRWKENKDETPAPNAYNTAAKAAPRTPGRSALPRPKPLRPHNRAPSTTLLNTSTTSNSSTNSTGSAKNKFVSPGAPPRLMRSGSCRVRTTPSEQQQVLLQQLQRERDDLLATVQKLKKKLSSLEQQLADAMAARERERDSGKSGSVVEEQSLQATTAAQDQQLQHIKSTCQSLTEVTSSVTSMSLTTINTTTSSTSSSPSMKTLDSGSTEDLVTVKTPDSSSNQDPVTEPELELMQEQIQHLTQLRDNLELSVARKDELIAELQLECHHLEQETRTHVEAVDRCHSHLRTLEDKLSESLYEAVEGSSGSSNTLEGVASVVGRVTGLVTRYETLLHTHTAHTTHCSHQITTLNDTLATLGEKVSKYEQEMEQLQASSREKSNKISGLEETVSELSLTTKEKEMMEAMMQEEIRQRNHEMSMLEEGYTSLEQKVAEAEQRAAAATAEREKREASEKSVEQLSVMVREAEILQHFLEKEILSREQEISSSASKVKDLTAELAVARKVALDLQGEAEAQLNQVLVLKASLAAKDYDIDERDETIITLKDEIISKQELANDLQELLTTHKTAKTELATELEHKSKAIVELEQNISEVSSKLKTRDEQSARDLREKEVEFSCTKDMHQAEVEGLRAEKEGLVCQVAALKEDCEEGQRTIQKLKEKLTHSADTVKRLEEKIVELMAEVEDSEMTQEKRVEEGRVELEELSAQYSESLLELEATRRALTHTSQQHQHNTLLLEAAETDLTQVREELCSVQSNLSAKSEEYSTLEESLTMLSDKFSKLEHAKMAEDCENHELLRRVRVELQLSQQHSAALDKELLGFQTTNTGFMTQIQQLRQDLSKKAKAVEESKSCIELLREEKNLESNINEELNAELLHKAEQLEELNSEREELQQQLDHKQAMITDINTDFEREMARMLQEKERMAEEKESLMEEAECERNTAQQEKQQLQQQLEQLQQHIQDVVDLKDDFAEKVSGLERTVEELTAENALVEQTREQLQQIQEHNHKIKDDLSASDRMTAALEERSKELQQSMEECGAALTDKDSKMMELRDALQHTTRNLTDREQEVSEQAGRVCVLQDSVQELETELQEASKHREAAAELQQLMKLHQGNSCEESSELRSELQATTARLEGQIQDAKAATEEWRRKCLLLEKMVEPFRKQLESFEAEHALLLSTKSAAQKEVTDLSQKYASLLGHQNHKQKIHHVAKLKTENCRLFAEVAKLRVECDRSHKTARRLEERLEGRSDNSSRRNTLAGAGPAKLTLGKENADGPRPPLRPSNKQNRL